MQLASLDKKISALSFGKQLFKQGYILKLEIND
jgi:hypothetical protein